MNYNNNQLNKTQELLKLKVYFNNGKLNVLMLKED